MGGPFWLKPTHDSWFKMKIEDFNHRKVFKKFFKRMIGRWLGFLFTIRVCDKICWSVSFGFKGILLKDDLKIECGR